MAGERSWATYLYRRLWWPEGYSWRFAVAIGVFANIVGIFVAIVAFNLPQPVAPEDDLVSVVDEVIGVDIQWWHTVIVLKQHPLKFDYSDAAGDKDAVDKALAVGESIELRVEKEALARARRDPKRLVSVMALTVGGRPVRTYNQVAVALKQNNEDLRTYAPLFAAPFVVLGLLLFATARHEWRLKHSG